jgi:hypothetical protein
VREIKESRRERNRGRERKESRREKDKGRASKRKGDRDRENKR